MRRPWALPLVPLYWLALHLKSALSHPGRARRLANPVLSVGSLSAGGAGKTPVVMALADLLTRHGYSPDVLSRGYGRGSGAIEAVDPAGPATRFGDEPLEMAQAMIQTGLRVYVGADRYQAGLLAESDPTPRVHLPSIHLLDDGFQHRRLARTADIVLLTLADAQDFLLPAGNLREPLAALGRAHVIVLRETEAKSEALATLTSRHPHAKVWLIRRTLELPPETPRKLLAFCGLARPGGFFTMLQAAGCHLTGSVTFPDHHPYRPEDLHRLAAAAIESGAAGLVTTAKDAVKLTPAHRVILEAAVPLLIARLRITFVQQDQVWRDLQVLLSPPPALPRHEKMRG